GREQKEISLQQVLFEHRISLPVVGPLASMRFEGGRRNRRLVVIQDDRQTEWNISTPAVPSLLQSLRVPETQKECRRDVIVHSGKRIGDAPGPNLLRALEMLSDRLGAPEVVGSPRLGGA